MSEEKTITGSRHPTRYWHITEDDRVQCDLCPRLCRLKEGQRGLCFVRARENDAIILTTYGRSSGFCVDPIEKKPLNHFLPGSSVLSFGTAGCNLTCKFCQNWDMSKSREMDILADEATPEKIAQTAQQLGCSSVAFTYNDPVIFHEYAIDIAQACHELDIKTVAVTAGYIMPEPREEFFRYMDAANIDLKAFTSSFYKSLCGAELEKILETIEYVKHHTNTWLELTTLLIPGKNDSDEEIEQMTQWVVEHLGHDVPMHFSAFHPSWKMMDIPATPELTLKKARRIAMENGVHYAYTGNISDIAGGSTYCHSCGVKVIGRNQYQLGDWHLDESGHCQSCGKQVPGVFDGPPGTWGARRLPVRLSAM